MCRLYQATNITRPLPPGPGHRRGTALQWEACKGKFQAPEPRQHRRGMQTGMAFNALPQSGPEAAKPRSHKAVLTDTSSPDDLSASTRAGGEPAGLWLLNPFFQHSGDFPGKARFSRLETQCVISMLFQCLCPAATSEEGGATFLQKPPSFPNPPLPLPGFKIPPVYGPARRVLRSTDTASPPYKGFYTH